ncbi:MAG: undecaprenyl-phosphate glucose phosphotransferase [Phycisphaerales bacterium]|nr:MAG: undecaprenyl-phosphate glucose phosphotransferase [Phycisphaerales bacterium]
MLRRYALLFSVLQSAFDVLLVIAAWVLTYFIRFHSGLFSSPKGISPFGGHIYLTLLIAFLCYLGCSWAGLYRSRRLQTFSGQVARVFKACVISAVLISTALYYLYDAPYSRKLLAMFFVLLFASLVLSRVAAMAALRVLRHKGYNLRYYAVIGAGKKGQQLVRDLEHSAWTGMKCRFFVDNNPARIGRTLSDVPVYGPIEKTTTFAGDNALDEIYLSLTGSEAQSAYPVLRELQNKGVTVRVIPEWGSLLSMGQTTTVTVGSQILFSAAEPPLGAANTLLKHVFDRAMAMVLLLILAIPVCVIAVLIKLSSKGHVFYRQTRVGISNKEFEIIKFRTMKAESQEQTGSPQFAPDEARYTRIGAWLRRTSLDELPQLINVARGEMSLVGPRPERPNFAQQFSGKYKKYMLRHKVRPGMTGLAQVHDLRGDTTVRRRLLYDLYYIKNWSFALDFWILLRTPWHILRSRNAC